MSSKFRYACIEVFYKKIIHHDEKLIIIKYGKLTTALLNVLSFNFPSRLLTCSIDVIGRSFRFHKNIKLLQLSN